MSEVILNLLAWALGLAALYVAAWFLAVPLKWLLRLVVSAVLGGALLWVVNLAGGFFGVIVAINPLTAVLAGLLGLPGVALMLVVQALI